MEQRSMSDNISGMATQHRKIAEHLRAVCSALRDGCDLSDLTGELDRLAELTETHFVDEEKLMRLYGFDGLESHRRAHKLLSDRLAQLRKDIRDDFGEEGKKKLGAFLEGDFQYHVIEDMHAWERGRISRKFAYQRLHEHDSTGGPGNRAAYKVE